MQVKFIHSFIYWLLLVSVFVTYGKQTSYDPWQQKTSSYSSLVRASNPTSQLNVCTVSKWWTLFTSNIKMFLNIVDSRIRVQWVNYKSNMGKRCHITLSIADHYGIWDFHGYEYLYYGLLSYDLLQSGRLVLTFKRNMMLQSSFQSSCIAGQYSLRPARFLSSGYHNSKPLRSVSTVLYCVFCSLLICFCAFRLFICHTCIHKTWLWWCYDHSFFAHYVPTVMLLIW
jgi:hypothetical protein